MAAEPGDVRSAARIAVVHEWMTNRAGSERCVEAALDAFPDHQLLTTLFVRDEFPGVDPSRVRTSPLQRLFARPHGHIPAGPLLPLGMRSLRVDADVDAALLSFHHFSTHIRIAPSVPRVIYMYTPPRFVHRPATMAGDPSRWARAAVSAAPLLRRHERTRLLGHAARVAVISRAVAERARAVYGIDARVIHPPVDVERFVPGGHGGRTDEYLLVGRMVAYKRPDLAIDAFREMPDLRLRVVGGGRMARHLAASAPANVTFSGHVADDELARLYATARGLVFPGEEDFGIVPVEAMASGCPVVALESGGALDYVQPGRNGVFVTAPSVEAVVTAVRTAERTRFDEADVAASVQGFGVARFQRELVEEVHHAIASGRR